MKGGLMVQLSLVLFLLLVRQTVSIDLELPQSQQYKGVIIANASSAKDIIQKQSKVVILFSDANCTHCQQFSQTYSLLSSIHTHDIHYVKIEYSEDTAALFNEHAVQDVPYSIAFSEGQPLPWHFQCLGSSNSVLAHLIKWLKRIYGEIGQWDSQDDHSHQLVVDCGQSGLRKMWNSVSRTNLWLDVYCGSADFLGSSFAVVSQNGKSIEAWQFQRDNIDSLESKINRLILGYKYKYVLNWNVGIAQEIFVKKQNAFVLIVNNESLSQEVFGYYEQAKKYWFQRSGGHEAPVLFAVSDLSKTTEETTRLKRYLTGMAVSIRKEYSYPILGFIYHEQEAKVSRYVLNFTLQKTKANIQQFMEGIYEHIILKKDYKEGEAVVKKWFNELVSAPIPLDKDKKEEVQTGKAEANATNDKREALLINNQTKWKELLDPVLTPYPFFVYVSWGHSLQLQNLSANLKRWWEKDIEALNLSLRHDSHVSLYINMLNNADLPDHPGMTIEYVPTMLHIDHAKRVTQLAGVTDPQKLKNFMAEQVKIHEQEYQQLK